MEDKSKVESIVQHLRQYAEARWKLFLLRSSDKASVIISSIVSLVLLAISFAFVLLFLSVGAALWIGKEHGNISIGFLYVGLFYLLISIIFYVFRNALIKVPVINNLLSVFHEEDK